ncbi:hypothetical protein EDB86DRAFT_430169 [Lactarius hatsudake]|nr:hypothetical protein EDB86DRAFT_430169 [Lactarius hatsudake]
MAAPVTNAFRGAIPTTFAGNRAESEQFLREFRQFRRNNRTHDSIINPYSRVGLACSYIRGPIVNDWVDLMERTLDDAVQRTVNPIPETDEVLWTDFETAFKAAWTDTLSKQHAYQQLVTLRMNEDDVDAYIATFERLALVAGWHRDASGTVEFFRKGLTHNILRACLLRTTMPETMTEWQDAARAETQRARTMASCLPPRRTGPQKFQSSFYSHAAPAPAPTIPVSDGVVPMDIDAVSTTPYKTNPRLTPLSDTDRARYRKEGRCFRCRQVGHMAVQCPQQTNSVNSRPPLHTNELSTTPPQTTPSAITAMGHLLNLTEQDRQDVINNLLLMGMSGSAFRDADTPQINAIGLGFAPFTAVSPIATARDVDAVSIVEEPLPVPPPFLATLASLSLTDSPPPRPPRSPRRPCSPRIPPPSLPIVVEDDNTSGRGVKTSASLPVLDFEEPADISPRQTTPLTSRNMTLPTPALYESPQPIPPPRPTRSPLQPLFLVNAFERPRDPDEVIPQAPPRPTASRSAGGSRREDTRNTTQSGTDPGNTRDPNRQNPEVRRPRRTLYATNNDIHTWLQQIVYNNPSPRPRVRPPPPLGYIAEERTDTDPELREYRYDRTYDHAGDIGHED